MRLLGWLVIAAVVLGLSLDGRALAPGPLALVAAGAVLWLARTTAVTAARRWLSAAAAVSVAYGAIVLSPWVTSADPMGTMRVSQGAAAVGFGCYCAGLGRWLEAAGWTQPARQLRWCAAFFAGVAVAVLATVAAIVALIEPDRGPDAASGFDVIFSRQLPAVGSLPVVTLVAAGTAMLVVTLAALAAMSTMSTINRQVSRFLLGTGPAPEAIEVGVPAEGTTR